VLSEEEWTADTHVRHILTRLGVRSRAQVAVCATEHGLSAADPRRSSSGPAGWSTAGLTSRPRQKGGRPPCLRLPT